MISLTGLTSQPTQTFRTNIDTGDPITINLKYKASTQMWFLDVTYQDITINGLRVCNVLNLLQQYSRILPFGIYVQIPSGDKSEPFLINDFSTGRVVLNILDATEVDQIEAGYIVD